MKKIVLSVAFIAATTMSFAQVSIGTSSPEASSILDLTSTTQGFLPPRLIQAQMSALASPAEGLMVYCSDCVPDGIYLFTGSVWEHLAATPLVAHDVVTSESGRIWMAMNLGAQQVATSIDDADAYGDLYQWGRTTDGHEKRTSPVVEGPVASGDEEANFITNATAPRDWLSIQDDTRWGATRTNHDPCPPGFRVPTEAEFDEERKLFDSNDAAGAFGSVLKLPSAGYRRYDTGALVLVLGTYGSYWSSTIDGNNARHLYLSDSAAAANSSTRASGRSVRCIKEQ